MSGYPQQRSIVAGGERDHGGSVNAAMKAAPPGRWGVVPAVIVILAIHAVGRVGSFCSPVRADSYAYAAAGYRIAQGGVFYSRELSDVKPPGLYHLYALAYLFLPPGRATMIPVDTIFGLLGYWAVYLLARDLYGRGISLLITVAAAIAFNAFTLLDFATEGFGLSESFMVLPAALAVRQYLRAAGGKRSTPFLWCGMWVGAELAIKQTALPLVVALALHWTALALFARFSFRRWITGSTLMVGGMMAALTPFMILVVAQGTWPRALEVLGPNAARMLTLETAWPNQWRNVLPLWTPMAWCVIGLVWWLESWCRSNAGRAMPAIVFAAKDGGHGPRCHTGFLLIWLACECVMLVFLPLRAFHYYVLASLPLVLLSGIFWVMLVGLRCKLPARAAFSSVSVAAVLSIAFGRMVVDTMVPIAIARHRSYDAVADRAHFDMLVSKEVMNLGAPPDPGPN